MGNYNKLITAVIGGALTIINHQLGFDLTSVEGELVAVVIAIGTAIGVWAVPNVKSDRSRMYCAPVAVILAVGLMLSACEGSPETRAVNTLAITCDSYATALGQMTALRADGALTDTQIERVDYANGLADPVCSSGSLIDPTLAVTIVRGAIEIIEGVPK